MRESQVLCRSTAPTGEGGDQACDVLDVAAFGHAQHGFADYDLQAPRYRRELLRKGHRQERERSRGAEPLAPLLQAVNGDAALPCERTRRQARTPEDVERLAGLGLGSLPPTSTSQWLLLMSHANLLARG